VSERVHFASGDDPAPLRLFSRAGLPTRLGEFTIVAFARGEQPLEHVAVVRGDVAGERVPVRIHSECLTGDVLGSLKCDCRDQLEMALRELGAQSRGVLLYLKQEGRGIGLANKLKAYELQERGLDTVEANQHLGFDADERDYSDAAAMLSCLGVRSVVLMTNNPVTERIPLRPTPTAHNADYLLAKRLKLGHL
jgi:GTP cyclohydrolase II